MRRKAGVSYAAVAAVFVQKAGQDPSPAIQTLAEWEGSTDDLYSGAPPEGDERRDDYRASAKRLHDLNATRVRFVHDPAVWERDRT